MKLELANSVTINVDRNRLIDLWVRAYTMIPDSGLLPPAARYLRDDGMFPLMSVVMREGRAIEGKIKPSELIKLIYLVDDGELNGALYDWLVGDDEGSFIETADLVTLICGTDNKQAQKKILQKLRPEEPGVEFHPARPSQAECEAARKRLWEVLNQMQLAGEITQWDCGLWPLDSKEAYYCVDFLDARWHVRRSEMLELMQEIVDELIQK